MSIGLVLVIVIGGVLLIAVPIVWFLVWNRRGYDRTQADVMARLEHEAGRRGWRYELRNDAYCHFYNDADLRMRSSVVDQLFSPRDPFDLPPKAVEAHQIVSGVHRGHPFLAALFKVRYSGPGGQELAVWVRTPSAGPPLQALKRVRLESRVNQAIGRGDLRVGDRAFDDLYEVSTGDLDFAHAVLVPEVTRFLTTDPRQFWGFTVIGGNLDVVDRVVEHRDPARLVAALDLRCDLLELIPREAWGKGG